MAAALCGAKKKDGSGTCQRPPIKGRVRCYFHGGKSPGGIASPHFRTGKYSKYLPARMLSGYNRARVDPSLVSLIDELAVVDARIQDMMGRVDSGESGSLWIQCRRAFESLTQARQAEDMDKMAQELHHLGLLITRGHGDSAAWKEMVYGLFEEKRKLAESERKRMVELQQMVAVGQVMVLINQLMIALRQHVLANVLDPKAQQAIFVGVGDVLNSFLDVPRDKQNGNFTSSPLGS